MRFNLHAISSCELLWLWHKTSGPPQTALQFCGQSHLSFNRFNVASETKQILSYSIVYNLESHLSAIAAVTVLAFFKLKNNNKKKSIVVVLVTMSANTGLESSWFAI